MRAVPTAAFACSTAAAVERSVASALSRSERETRPLGASSRVLCAAICALVALACAWASAASAPSSAERSGAGSIWNSGCPALTSEPSTYNRRSSTPATRARTSAERVADSRPTRLRVSGTACACTATTPTCGGGGAVGGPERAQPPSSRSSAAPPSERCAQDARRTDRREARRVVLVGQLVAKAVLSSAVISPAVFRIASRAHEPQGSDRSGAAGCRPGSGREPERRPADELRARLAPQRSRCRARTLRPEQYALPGAQASR